MFREYHFSFIILFMNETIFSEEKKKRVFGYSRKRRRSSIFILEIRSKIRNFKIKSWFQYRTLWYSLTAFGDDRIDWGDNGIGVHNFFMLFISSFIDGFGTNDEQLFSSFWQAAIYCMFALSCFMLGTLTTKYIQICI